LSDAAVSVVIPVGPYAFYKQWLGEAIESVKKQSHPASQILLIDDMAGLSSQGNGVTLWRAPWRLGGVGAFNCGVALAESDLVFLLSCDDTIDADCLHLCIAAWQQNKREDAYYWVGCRYSDGREGQALPFLGAMVTKGLWRMVGGFPIEATSGAGDAALVSILLTHFPDRLVKVANGRPLYNYRVHTQTETANAGPWLGVIGETRGLVTKLWKQPQWGRMIA